MRRISKKLLASIFIVLIIISAIFIKPTKAISEMQIKTIPLVDCQTIQDVYGENIVCSSKSTDKLYLLMIEDSSKVRDEDYPTMWDEYGSYYIKNKYKLFSTKDAVNFESSNIGLLIESLYSVNSDNRILLTSMQEKNGTLYICGSIARKASTPYNWDYTGILIKTVDGKNFEKVDIPTYEYEDIELTKYKDTYIIAGYSNGYTGKRTYEYYTSTDLEEWTRREFTPLRVDNIWSTRFHSITSAGVTFADGNCSGEPPILLLTSDFTTYNYVNQDGVGFEDYGNYNSSTKSDSIDYAWYLTAGGEYRDNGDYENNILRFYISPNYPGEYKEMLNFRGTFKNCNTICTWGNESKQNKECPIMLFIDRGSYASMFVYDSYKNTNYVEYVTNINPIKIGDSFTYSSNEYGFIYNNECLILTDDSFKTMNKMQLPIYVEGQVSFKDKLVFIGNSSSIVMNKDDIFSSINPVIATTKTGDIDENGKITTKDAKMVLQHIVKKIKLTEDEFKRADTDGNGKITTKDAKLILQYIVKKISKFPVEG